MTISISTYTGMVLIKVSIVPKGFKDFEFGVDGMKAVTRPWLLIAIAYLCGGWVDSFWFDSYRFNTEAQREHFCMWLRLLGIKQFAYYHADDYPF